MLWCFATRNAELQKQCLHCVLRICLDLSATAARFHLPGLSEESSSCIPYRNRQNQESIYLFSFPTESRHCRCLRSAFHGMTTGWEWARLVSNVGKLRSGARRWQVPLE